MRRVSAWIIGLAATIPVAAQGATYTVDQRVGGGAGEGQVFRTIAAAVAAAKEPGDVVLVGAGIYREGVKVTASGTKALPIRIEAAPGAVVVVTGADVLAGWKREPGDGPVCSVAWDHVFMPWSPTRTHPGDDYHRLIGRAEQVFVGGLSLRQVLEREKVTRGTFFVDEAGKRLYACAASGQDLSGARESLPPVEVSARSMLWECRGEYVVTKGLRFRYAANRAQEGAAVFSGRRDRVEDCLFEQTNGVGAVFQGEDVLVRRCAFVANGQMGFGATRAHGLLISGCVIRGNNTKGFDRGWEAGGDKLTLCRAAVIEGSTFADNHGSGVWFDMGNEDCVIRNCLIENNEDAGIFDEISYGLRATDNVIVGNGFGGTPGSWGAGGGICLSSSPGSVVERNVLLGNREGISLREQARTTPRIDGQGKAEDPVWNHDEEIHHNVMAYNRDAGLWGWFDVSDERQWPAAIQEQKGRAMSLETLHLAVSNNYYCVAAGDTAAIFHWGTSWRRNGAWRSLEEVRGQLGLEGDSVSGPARFADVAALDLRVMPDSPLLRNGCYPRGEVTGVRLGTMERE